MEITADGFGVVSAASGDRPARSASKRPVDLVHLARYTLGNRALEREVLELFLTQSRLYLKRLKEAVQDRAWHDAAHTIKGSARGIGAWHIAKTAESAETLEGEALESSRGAVVATLERQIDEANGFIRTLLADG